MVTHTLSATYDRSATSAYGFSVGTNTNIMASWNWHRPGGRLSLFSSFGQQQQRNTAFFSLSGWEALGGFSENLGSQTAVSVQYVYLDSTGQYSSANPYHITTNSVRLSLSWAPHPALR